MYKKTSNTFYIYYIDAYLPYSIGNLRIFPSLDEKKRLDRLPLDLLSDMNISFGTLQVNKKETSACDLRWSASNVIT